MVRIFLHEILVHSLYWLLARFWTPSTRFGCISNLSLDEERRNIHSIHPHRQSSGVSEAVPLGQYYCVTTTI